MYDILELNDKLVSELKEIARLMNIQNYDEFRKQELIYKILDQQALNPSASNSIRDSLSSKNFGGEQKVEMKKAEPAKEAPVAPPPAEPSRTSVKRRRIIPERKEGSPAMPAQVAVASPPPPPAYTPPPPRQPVEEAPAVEAPVEVRENMKEQPVLRNDFDRGGNYRQRKEV